MLDCYRLEYESVRAADNVATANPLTKEPLELTIGLKGLLNLSRTIFGTFLLITFPSQAQTTAMEPFSYNNGPLVGQSGGSGWLGSWLAISTISSPGITPTGLAFSGYSTAGGGVRDTSGSFAATRKWFTPNTGFTNDTTIWFSCLRAFGLRCHWMGAA